MTEFDSQTQIHSAVDVWPPVLVVGARDQERGGPLAGEVANPLPRVDLHPHISIGATRRFFSGRAVRNVTRRVGHIPTKLDSDNESLGATSVVENISERAGCIARFLYLKLLVFVVLVEIDFVPVKLLSRKREVFTVLTDSLGVLTLHRF